MSGLVKGKTARFVLELEDDYAVLDPAKIALERDHSAGFLDTKLFLESAFRSTPTTTSQPLTLGKAAIDDLAFQHVPVKMALAQDRAMCGESLLHHGDHIVGRGLIGDVDIEDGYIRTQIPGVLGVGECLVPYLEIVG
jgi:hypothetical protein